MRIFLFHTTSLAIFFGGCFPGGVYFFIKRRRLVNSRLYLCTGNLYD